MKGIKKLFSSIEGLLYPPLCLHCKNSIEGHSALFCAHCSPLLDLIPTSERCPFCFSHQDGCKRRACSQCQKSAADFNGLAAALDYQGPAATLVQCMKYENQPYLAEGAASFLVMQWAKLEWPLPDLIIPVPITWMHRIFRGYNQSALLAKSFGKIVNRPVAELLLRRNSGWRQAGLTKMQRKELTPASFSLRRPFCLQDKIVLIIDDVLTTSMTMRCCSQVIAGGYPKSIYGLCLCGT